MNYNDRGNKKWTAMFLPEHRDRLYQWAVSQKDISPPTLAMDQLDELNQLMHQHLQDQQPVIVSYYAHKRMEQLRGILHSCDPITRILVVYSTDYESVQIRLQDIFSITTI